MIGSSSCALSGDVYVTRTSGFLDCLLGRKKRGRLLCCDADAARRLLSVEHAVHTTMRTMGLKEVDAICNDERF